MQRSALSATFDFWYAPSQSSSSLTDEMMTTEGGCATNEGESPDSSSSSPQSRQHKPQLPSPHAQLLFEDEHPSFVELKGQDHRQQEQAVVVHDDNDDESDDDDDNDQDMLIIDTTFTSQTSVPQGQGPALPHIFGGGGTRRHSWLLGFARPRSTSSSSSTVAVKSSTHNEAQGNNNNNNINNNKLKRMLIHHHHHDHDDDASAVIMVDDSGSNTNLLLHSLPPGLVRVPSGSSLDDDEEDCSSSSSSDSSLCASPTSSSQRSSSGSTTSSVTRPKGVSFSPAVKVQPIPHSSLLSHSQRLRMYTTSDEVRKNKIRNKMEYRHDGYDWRNVSEEWEMGVDMVTGELIHPVHEAQPQHARHHQRL